jgi:hypothetical protein
MRIRCAILILSLAVPVVSCRAEPNAVPSWSQITIQVPVGYRQAVVALLPGARILEKRESAPASVDSPAIDLIASFTPPAAKGYYERGSWLFDRVRLMRRLTGDEANAPDSLLSWIVCGDFEEGAPRFGLAPGIAERLGEAHPLVAAFLEHGRRLHGEATIEDLLAGRMDAAFLDGATFAALHRREHPGRDLLVETVLAEGTRELRLYATRNRMDLGPAVEILMKGRPQMEALGYDPAR